MNEIEEVINFKKDSKKFILYIILGLLLLIPWLLITTVQVLQQKMNIINLIAFLIFGICYLLIFFILGSKLLKREENLAKAVFKHPLLKLGNEEYVDEKTKNEFYEKIKQNLKDNIKIIDHVLKLKIKFNIVDFFDYVIEEQLDDTEEDYDYHFYSAMMVELSEKNTMEKYEKILLEKNKISKFNYTLNTIDNKLIISILVNHDIDVVEESSDPISEFFKSILSDLF